MIHATPASVSTLAAARDAAWSPFEAVSDLVVVGDRAGAIVFANRAARSTLGVTSGARVVELLAPGSRPGLAHATVRLARGETAVPVSLVLRVPRGTDVGVDGTLHPRWEDGRLAGAFAVLRPAAGTEARAAFLSQVAHELRTPLTTVRGALQLMRGRVADTAADPAVEQLFGLAQNGTDRLLGLVEDWLDLAALDAGTLQLAGGAFSADEVVHAIVERVRPLAARRGVALDVRVSATRAIAGDRARLGRVLGHLLDNALAFAPASSTVVVTAGDGEEDATVVVTIEDAGPGIPAAQLDRVAQPFVTHPMPGRRTTAGIGLGLPLCRAVVERHGGHLLLESAPGRTRVSCTLPGT